MKLESIIHLMCGICILFSISPVTVDAKVSPGNKKQEAPGRTVTGKDHAEKKARSSKIAELMKKQKQVVVFRTAYGNGPGQLGCVFPQEAMPEGPMSFAVDNSGRIFILDQLNKRIQVINKSGKYLKAIPIPNQFVSDIDISQSGNLFLLDGYSAKSVLLIDQKGRILKKTGLRGKCVDRPEQVTEMCSRKDGVWVESDGLYVNICDELGDDVGDRAVADYMPCSDGMHHIKAKKLGDITALITWRLAGDFSNVYDSTVYTEIPILHFTLVDTDKKGNIYIGLSLFDEAKKGPDYSIENLHEVVVITDGTGKEKKRIYMPVSTNGLSPTRTIRVTPEGTIYQLELGDNEAVMRKYTP